MKSMTRAFEICYLCGEPISEQRSFDHVPPKQFYAKELRRKHNVNLLRLPVHESCNNSYQRDEDYFVNSLIPFARGSYAGDCLRRKILDDGVRQPPQRRLLERVIREFERQPSGILLPPGVVVKRFEGDRILRVAWKIVRGLYFYHFTTFVPEGLPRACEVVLPGQEPPLPFFFLPEQPVHGPYPGVFDYRFASYPEIQNLNYWALLLWDRLIVIVKFEHPKSV